MASVGRSRAWLDEKTKRSAARRRGAGAKRRRCSPWPRRRTAGSLRSPSALPPGHGLPRRRSLGTEVGGCRSRPWPGHDPARAHEGTRGHAEERQVARHLDAPFPRIGTLRSRGDAAHGGAASRLARGPGVGPLLRNGRTARRTQRHAVLGSGPPKAQKHGVRPLKLHAARHTFATLALEAGRSIRWRSSSATRTRS